MGTALNDSMIPTTPLTPGTCEWCGDDCDPAKSCCSLSCEAQMHREEAAQGRMVLRVLKLWRKTAGKKGTDGEGSWTKVGKMTGGFLKNDRMRRERMGLERRKAKAAEMAAKEKTDDD